MFQYVQSAHNDSLDFIRHKESIVTILRETIK